MNSEKILALLVFAALGTFLTGMYFLSWQRVDRGFSTLPTATGAVLVTKLVADDTNEISLVAVGDVMLSRTVERKMQKNGVDYPFRVTADFLRGADIAFANLECPITAGNPVEAYEMSFRAPIGSASVLHDAGFDMLSLANNHTMNFGVKGILDTLRFLGEAGVTPVGAGRDGDEANAPKVLNVKGMRFAFLAYHDEDVVPDGYEAGAERPGTAFMRIERMKEAVKAAKAQADFVIVSMHSGIEYVDKPNKHQTSFAHAAIDAGAEMVIGHHPHVVQTLEKYNGKYIFYSLGNFVFDQMEQRETREGLAIKIIFGAMGVMKISLHPVLITDYAQPRFLHGEEAERVVEKLNYPVPEDPVFAG